MPLYQEQAAFRAGTALVAQIPDNTATGGNARGANAVDLQTLRGSSAQVASGANSVVAGGQGNTASFPNSTVGGGVGNSAVGSASTVAGGNGNTAATGAAWVPGGVGAVARGIHAGAWSAGRFATDGDAQAGEYVLRRQTTDATPTRLTADAAAAGAANTVNLPNNSDYVCEITLTGRQNTAGGGRFRLVQTVALSRDANAASTVIDTVVAAVTNTRGTVTGWAVAVAADTTNGGLSITVTGAAATTINWVARIKTVEVVA